MNDKPIYGGQTIIEGVMLHDKKYVACTGRDPRGNIVTTREADAQRIAGAVTALQIIKVKESAA